MTGALQHTLALGAYSLHAWLLLPSLEIFTSGPSLCFCQDVLSPTNLDRTADCIFLPRAHHCLNIYWPSVVTEHLKCGQSLEMGCQYRICAGFQILSTQKVCISLFLMLIFVQSQSCRTLCDPIDCSTPGFPVLHYLPESAQIHRILLLEK